MPDKRDTLRSELEALVERGETILEAELEVLAEDDHSFARSYRGRTSDEDDEPRTPDKIYPDFVEDYQRWYSLAVRVLDQVLPERVGEFKAFYSGGPRGSRWAIDDYIRKRGEYDVFKAEVTEALRQGLSQQIIFLKAAADRLDAMLADIRGVLEAEIFDTTLERAQELFAKKHLRAAGVVAGVVLETHLKDVCRNHGVKLRKQKPTIGDLNSALKDAGVPRHAAMATRPTPRRYPEPLRP